MKTRKYQITFWNLLTFNNRIHPIMPTFTSFRTESWGWFGGWFWGYIWLRLTRIIFSSSFSCSVSRSFCSISCSSFCSIFYSIFCSIFCSSFCSSFCCKGQIVLEGLFCVHEFSQKMNQQIRRISSNEFVCFLGKFEDTKSPFEIIWPLVSVAVSLIGSVSDAFSSASLA